VIPAPWYDANWVNDVLVATGFLVAGGIYGATQHSGTQQQRRSTLNHLNGVKASMKAWGDSYFDTAYEGAGLDERVKMDRDLVLGGKHMQNFMVPIQPVESLVEPPGDSWPLEPRTVEAAGAALQRMTAFNQLVQQQTDFHARHAADYKNPEVPKKRPHRRLPPLCRRPRRSASRPPKRWSSVLTLRRLICTTPASRS
jgi:hypothetical protein